eukprot:CAMPEP_0202824240 /NCGR_PEP_ID=MMETSP1389-20130828/12217_1 /ASSEMBLY_ACC=CAM_ASM_000865 /TAXON_ID=302021 /ORGANISM="Rhodomonas sp., Strain CCMP768" /LENGTH=61 /DNA_ID=CAMNT_0049497309 /DNA_START=180 /DNA_END=361 /DNA_ORIENTATION=-
MSCFASSSSTAVVCALRAHRASRHVRHRRVEAPALERRRASRQLDVTVRTSLEGVGHAEDA